MNVPRKDYPISLIVLSILVLFPLSAFAQRAAPSAVSAKEAAPIDQGQPVLEPKEREQMEESIPVVNALRSSKATAGNTKGAAGNIKAGRPEIL